MVRIFISERCLKPKLFFYKSLLATALFQVTLLPLYISDLIYYNPIITLSDIFSNYLFILLLAALFNNVAPPLILLYFIYGLGVAFYYFTRRNLLLSDIVNIQELFLSYPVYGVTAIALFSLFLFFLFEIRRNHFFSIGEVKAIPATKFLVVSIAIFTILFSYLQPGVPFSFIVGKNVDRFNTGASWKHGGQIYSIYYAALEDRINSTKIYSHVIQDSAFNLKPFELSQTPNVYLLVLESFRPIHSLDREIVERIAEKVDINRLVRFNDVGVSPVFGGMSAGAEFELLCGVPELKETLI